MPRARERRFFNGMELWNLQASPSGAGHTALVTIAQIFEQIDRVMLDEMQDDMRRHAQPNKESTERSTSASRFSDMQADKDPEIFFEDVKKGISHTSSETDILAYLTSINCLTAWSWVFKAVLEYQGRSDHSHLLPWSQASDLAAHILDLARAVLEIYESEKYQDLTFPGREGVDAGIEAKLRTLLLWNRIHSRPTYEDTKNGRLAGSHSFWFSLGNFFSRRKEEAKAKKSASDVRAHQKVSDPSE